MTKLPDTLINLDLYGVYNWFSLSFIANFKILQKLQLSFQYEEDFKDFENYNMLFFHNYKF